MLDLSKLFGIKQDMDSKSVIHIDVYRYKRNKLASGLALLALVFECLYFMLFYSLRVEQYYTALIGLDIVLNLAVLLIVFLSSEGVKGYNKKYCIPLLVIAVIQIARIFLYPMDIAAQGGIITDGAYDMASWSAWYFGTALSTGATSAILIVYLVASAACLVASAIFGYIRATQLEIFTKKLEDGTISVEKSLAELNAQEVESVVKNTEVTNA